jgi:glycosyltransferase involved in cell wall biosynthesis
MISVITICYNETPNKIRRTLSSILLQDYPLVELIVIDGGSGDRTLQALDEYRNDIRHYVSEPDRGIFDAMNKGLALSGGEWIIFMNVGDSFVTPWALSDLVNNRTATADIVYGDIIRADEGRVRSPRRVSKYLLYYSGICHQAIVARRSLFSRIGGFDAALPLGGDPDWLLRAHRHGAVFMHVPTVVCHYEAGGASADYRKRNKFRAQVIQRHFSVAERLVYGAALGVHKCVRRVITLNFKVPVSIIDWFKRAP